MRHVIKLLTLILFVVLGIMVSATDSGAQRGKGDAPAFPKTWDDAAVDSTGMPLAEPSASPVHIRSDYYYSIPVRPIYKSYPIYGYGKEPPGYLEWLQKQEPEIISFDTSKFKTEEDWIKAGEIVFDAPAAYERVPSFADVRNPEWYKKTDVPLTKEGIMPFARYVIKEKGVIEVGDISCAECHVRVMRDGTVIKGAQGNFPFDRADSFAVRRAASKAASAEKFAEQYRLFARGIYAAPWLRDDPNARLDKMSLDEIHAAREVIPPGVVARQAASIFYPVQVPDLIGIKSQRYLDHTGLVLHRSIGDLMRYAAFNYGGDDLAHYGDFYPFEPFQGKVPDPSTQDRYSDEQLYALSLYIYSLKPPPNPNKFDALAARGQKVFDREGCGSCHAPPLYTNNKLTPVEGFRPPQEHLTKYDILPVHVGTDPNLALKTRRGTGYYKVPSLRGLWYRGPLEHMGSVLTLEDWFDPRRLKDDYVPTGFRGYKVRTRAVAGHLYGLGLSESDRKALIAFLKTL